jgi:hypothetical membrane protein
MSKKIKILKRIHLYLSIVIFFTLVLYSLHNKHLNLTEISLSRFGINKDGWIWNTGLICIAVLLYYKIKDSVTNYIRSKTLKRINIFLITNLILTAAINMNYALHDLVAFTYFIGTTSIMFIFGMKLHKTNFRIAQTSMVISILSIVIPMLSMNFIKTLAIPEILHISLLFLWLFILEHEDGYIKLLKKIGL